MNNAIEDIWPEFLAIAREEVGSRAVETWFCAMNFVRWDSQEKIAYLNTPNTFVRDWVAARYTPLLERSLARLLHEEKIGIYLTQSGEHEKRTTVSEVKRVEHSLSVVPAVRASAKSPRIHRDKNAQSLYRFDNFVVGSHNSLAYAAAQAVADRLGTLYNPFFIYGNSGLGKTHLLHAIGNEVRARHAGCTILYQSANRFVSDFINAIRFDKVYQFELQYRNVDLLLIDDIQFISNKEQTQEFFFHIFNVLHQAHKQIICTSDSLPRDIAGLADRVRSRLESGLVADISEPSFETKVAIIKRKAEQQGSQVDDAVAEYIASLETNNVRDLEGALIRVFAYASLTKQAPTLEVAQQALVRRTEPKKVAPITLPAIAQKVAARFSLSVDQLKGKARTKDIAQARHVALFLMKKLTSHSLREIGTFLRRRDHTTVMHALEKIEQQRGEDATCDRLIKDIEHELSA
jgi:chromosomal replication initiator protein